MNLYLHLPPLFLLCFYSVFVVGFDHRKLLVPQQTKTEFEASCFYDVGNHKLLCFKLPPPPPQEIKIPIDTNKAKIITIGMVVMACVIIFVVTFGILSAIVRVYYLRRARRRRRSNSPIIFAAQEDFLDEDHGPEIIDHHIWYINTIGLPQRVIDSITVFKYKINDGFIEGTDCSVCLNEFQEDESLRLLPKCNHAFHIPCIDTWLRSHKNCPLCRAPVMMISSESEPNWRNWRDLDSRNENLIESSENVGGVGGERETSEVRNAVDHGDRGRLIEEDMQQQPMRRSVSLDSCSALKIYDVVASVMNDQESLKSDKRSRGSFKSSSIGSSLQKGPILIKRSFSFNGKISMSMARHGRCHSMLPLRV